MPDAMLDESTVRLLLAEQHPDLADLPLERVAAGWDNESWRLGVGLVVRLPRTDRAPTLLHKERRWLPSFASHLPLPISVHIRNGQPTANFPKPWAVTRWIRGEPGDRVVISNGPATAERLAQFLRALHRATPSDAPDNSSRGVPLSTRTNHFREKLEAVAQRVDADAIQRVWDEAISAEHWDRADVWIHGDLHPANVMIECGTLAGVIDFGELCGGDPATDVASAWMLLPSTSRSRFCAAYGIDDATWRRARGWAVLFALSQVGIGQAWERGLPGGQPTWGRMGRRTIERVLKAE